MVNGKSVLRCGFRIKLHHFFKTLNTYTMSQTIISRTGKNRRGYRNVILNGHAIATDYCGPFKMVVERTEAGYKKKNGKPAMMSKTKHLPA